MRNVLHRRPLRSGFTLIELLIVVAIIGILAALLSTAILKLTKTAAAKRNQNNAERLEAAITEYWHDMGRWPLPKGAKPKFKKGTGRGLAGSANENQNVDTYTYTMSFSSKNWEVVQNLLEVDVPGGKKTFLDLHGYSIPLSGTEPYSDIADAYVTLAAEDGTIDKEKLTAPLVYFSPFLECPKCHRLWAATGSRDYCTNDECTYFVQNGTHYRFTKSDKAHPVSRAKPFVIDFDLFNNVVKVRAP